MGTQRRFRQVWKTSGGPLTDLLSRLIRLDTTHGKEAEIQQLLREELDALGLETRVPGDPESAAVGPGLHRTGEPLALRRPAQPVRLSPRPGRGGPVV